MIVSQLWRYPVKSIAGEQLAWAGQPGHVRVGLA